MFDQFSQMPKGMQVLMAALGGTSLVAIAAMIDPRALLIVAIGIVIIAIAIFCWLLFQKWKARQRAKALGGQLSAHSAATPNSISDPSHRAKLDDLRQSFGRGLEKFRTAGKDLYSLPWYVVCGEPGSGKTEAVRHCNVGFPPGLQDEMQGAGGTINMHWWFTNHAVLIDTAGKLLFQEAPPGSTTEWSEFLKLLRKARPSCPVNGLLLVIPSESLIRDSFEEIQRKAGKIAQQLDTIQRTLDVRFPVFVLITKCDLINGFREFFTGVKDPQLQHQMTGWSNPDTLDTAFRPDTVDQHLSEVVQRISRRRLGLLRDPAPADAGKRRLDEVDALFALPASIGALAPRLRKYLEAIFVAGEWSAKPLFLRGIYFTSALTEGSALDAELATALGMPVEQLPEGKAWERERSFFLRDLFLQKIFKEKGLVTRASNTGKLIRRRQWIIGSVALIGMLTVVGVSIWGIRAVKKSIGEELDFWRAGVLADNWNGKRWRPIVNNRLEYTGNDIIRLENGQEWPVTEYHEQLRKRVSTDLRIPWVFKVVEALAVRSNPARRESQKVLFEAGVIGPIVEANRDRLINLNAWTGGDADRLAALIQLEGAIHLKGVSGYTPDYPAEDFFSPLFAPSLAKVTDGPAVLNRLMQVYEWTYTRGAGRGEWPPAWLSRGKTLRDNQPLVRGWDALDRSLQTAQTGQRDALQAIQTGRLTAVRYVDSEKTFIKAVAQPRSGENWVAGIVAAWDDLAARRTGLDQLAVDLKQRSGLTTEITLDGAYRATADRVRADAGRTAQRVRAVMAKQRAAADEAGQATTGAASEFTLYRDIGRRLSGLDAQITAQLDQLLPASEQAQLADLDAVTLRAAASGGPNYVARFTSYDDVMKVIRPVFAEGAMFGRLNELVASQAPAWAALSERVPKYDGALRAEFAATMKILLDAAPTLGVDGLADAYRREVGRAFPESMGYPLGTGAGLTPEQFRSIATTLEKVPADINAPAVTGGMRRSLETHFSWAGDLAALAKPLLASDGSPVTAKLVLLRDRDQASAIERALKPAMGPRQALTRVYPTMRINGRSFRLRSLADNVEVDKLSVAARMPRIELFTTPDPKPQADAVIDLSDTWSLLHLIQQGAVRRADGKEWDMVVRLNDRGTELVLALTAVFDQPLPPVEKWPTRAP